MRAFLARLPGALCLVLIASAWAQESDPYGQAMDQATKDVKTIADSVKKERDYIGKARAALEAAKDELKESDLAPAQKKAALDKILEVSKKLQAFDRPLKRFTDAVAPVTKAQEVWKELNDMKAQVTKDQETMGDLAAEMRVISKVMTNVGKEVPLIGGFIETYGKMTGGILDATGKVAETLAQERNQGMVGLGAHASGTARTMDEALKGGFPELHDGMTFEPSQPPWVYIPIGQEKRPQLIWDDAAGTWEQVPDAADAVEIFRRSLRAGRRPDPASLLILCNHWDKALLRQQAAGEILGFIDSLRRSIDDDVLVAFRAVYFHSNPVFDELEDAIDDPDGFASRYMYARDCYSETNALLGNMYQALSDRHADPKVVARLVALAKKYGIQEVLDRIKEEPDSLPCLRFSFLLAAPVQLDYSGREDASENSHEEGSETLELDVEDEEMKDGVCFQLRRGKFEHAITRKEYGTTARYRISGVVALDMSAIKSLTVTYDLDPIDQDDWTANRNWSVTVTNIPRSFSDDDPSCYTFEVSQELPKGFAVAQAEFNQTRTHRFYDRLPTDVEKPTKLRETIVNKISDLDVSRIEAVLISVYFEDPKTK